MGFHGSVLRADYDAGENRYGNSAGVANRAVANDRLRDRSRVSLADVADLSRRNADVWKEGLDSRSLALGEASLTNADFRFRIADFELLDRERADAD